MPEFVFDVTLVASVSITAASKAEAKATIMDCVDGASCNAGAWPSGDPILFEVGVEGELDLSEIDGEPAYD